jgi:Tfp pilus assembly protein PilP
MRSVITLIAGSLLTVVAAGSHAQGQPSSQPAKKPATTTTAKPSGTKAAAKPATKKAVKKNVSAKTSTTAPAGSSAEAQLQRPGRRDPFESLVGRQKAAADAAKNLPPGKGGLQVSTLKIDGIVHGPNGMIAVVSNPQQRTYFLREGDQLYDGRVEKIAMDGVTFHESGKDSFGKPVERQVNKRIYTSSGEEQ